MKNLLLIFVIITSSYTLKAQSPEKFSYQAIIRNSNGDLIVNSTIGIKISILQGSVTGSPVFTELQTVQSNLNGLISFEIGTGVNILGNISSIDWSNGPYFIKNEHDILGGTNYTISGVSELLSVPYAEYAKNGLPNGSAGSTVYKGNSNWESNQALFNDGTYVGINQTTPIGASGFDVTVNTNSNNWGGMYVNTTSSDGKPFYGFAANGIALGWFEVRGTSSDLVYYNGSTDILTIAGDDKIGIANTNPQYTLDLNGDLRLNTGINASGKVLTSSSSDGIANWSTINDDHIANRELSHFYSAETFSENDGFTTVTRTSRGYSFVNNFNEGISASVNVPNDWDGTPVQVDVYYYVFGTGTGTAGFFIRCNGVSVGENYILDPGTTNASLNNISGVSGTLYKQTFTISDLSINDDLIRFYSIQRNTSGTFTGDLTFLGAKIRYNAKR